jgi:hypothetical protein
MGVLGKALDKAMPELMNLAETRAGPRCDNLSVIAVQWLDKAVAAPAEPLTVPMEDRPAAPGAEQPDYMRMTDADIERQIAEIKQALKKHDPGGN